MDRKDILKHFLEDTADHTMTIENDTGVFRHLHFARGRSSIYHFTLTTWPGHLCIGGDCGTYVFSRVHDMFRFFRMDERDFNYIKGELSINPGYWSEKLETGGGYRREVHSEWSPEAFEARAQEYLDDWLEGFDPEDYDDEEEAEEVKREVTESIQDLKNVSCDQWDAVSAVRDFSSDYIDLTDFFEDPCSEYRSGYIWCLYAIVWGIQMYDRQKLVGPAMDKFLAIRGCAKNDSAN